MLKKIRNSLIVATTIAGVMFIASLFIVFKLPHAPQQIIHVISDWFTIIVTGVGVMVPFVVRCGWLERFMVGSSSLFMLIMYIIYKMGFETTKELVSMYGFNIATSYRSIIIIALFIMLAKRVRDANIINNKNS